MTSKDDHAHKNVPAPPVRENPPQKAPPSPHLKDTSDTKSDDKSKEGSSPPRTASAAPTSDPSVVQPVVRSTETLPVEPRGPDDRPEAVRHARHAEKPEEVEKLDVYEHSKVPPPGSRNYVAGQPVSEEERDATEEEATRLAEAGEKERREAEKRSREMSGDDSYHPVDPDHPDPTQRRENPAVASDPDHTQEKGKQEKDRQEKDK